MEDYIGKVCPFCKTEIKEEDAVKVCPACGIPHHEGCWNENNGCTTFGCTEKQETEQAAKSANACTNCGFELSEGQAFCPKCGTAKPAPQPSNVCANCGTELVEGQEFCGKCGTKVGVVVNPETNAAIGAFNADIEKKKKKSKTKPLIIIGVIVALILGVLIVPELIVTPEKLMAKGDYITAYEKAEDIEKDGIVAANAVAICSNICVNSLKDSHSFDLRDAWYNEVSYSVVLKVAANNSYGNTVINYWYFTWDEDECEYSLFTSIASFTEEKTYSWDDSDERLEKLLNNVARRTMKLIMVSDNEIPAEDVTNINNLFNSGLLDDVVLIDIPRDDE